MKRLNFSFSKEILIDFQRKKYDFVEKNLRLLEKHEFLAPDYDGI